MSVTNHILGYPRIGENRELKKALESYWKKTINSAGLEQIGWELKEENWTTQINSGLNLLTIGDFSFYDHVLDTSFLFGNIPSRFKEISFKTKFDQYFAVARGYSQENNAIRPSAMRKWFNTNYHYIVPELKKDTCFALNPEGLLENIRRAKSFHNEIKPVLVGPLTYLWLGEGLQESDRLSLLPQLTEEYAKLLALLKTEGIEWVQIDEPILIFDFLPKEFKAAFKDVYANLCGRVKILIGTYFEDIQENSDLVESLNVEGIHLDLSSKNSNFTLAKRLLAKGRVVSLGIVNGRNIWPSNLENQIEQLREIDENHKENLWLAPSCSLIHIPLSLEKETQLTEEQKSWLAFGKDKLQELKLLKNALNHNSVEDNNRIAEYSKKRKAFEASKSRCNGDVQEKLSALKTKTIQRKSGFTKRKEIQKESLGLPLLPTTTIGSFPQTDRIRRLRYQWKKGLINQRDYEKAIEKEIRMVIEEQEQLNLDVLVHGEPERNDMVEYFAQYLEGFLVTQYGWVQSYGSRCVKPPILYGDVSLGSPITAKWISFAQSLTTKPVKGMLTGPVTMLKWSFVRDDQPYKTTARQIALAINKEVNHLIDGGAQIIQIDEAAYREAQPLKRRDLKDYYSWAAEAFRICTLGIGDNIQIHTHMCYSQFDAILSYLEAMDADVITIETARSEMSLLEKLPEKSKLNDIGPGVYDIHSPNIPSKEKVKDFAQKALKHIPLANFWLNPDCGLKTRNWEEVRSALANITAAAEELREEVV